MRMIVTIIEAQPAGGAENFNFTYNFATDLPGNGYEGVGLSFPWAFGSQRTAFENPLKDFLIARANDDGHPGFRRADIIVNGGPA